MYIRVRKFGAAPGNDITINLSKTIKIKELYKLIFERIPIDVDKQRLFYNGKELNGDHELYEYDIRLNDVVQVMERVGVAEIEEKPLEPEKLITEVKEEIPTTCEYYKIGDKIDVQDINGAWFEAKVDKITKYLDSDDTKYHCTQECKTRPSLFEVDFDCIRPRSKTVLTIKQLSPGMRIMVNYNIDNPKERGYYYDFKISFVYVKSLKGTLFIGKDNTPLIDIRITLIDEIYKIEKPTKLVDITDEIVEFPPWRIYPPNCLKCNDNPKIEKCKECGCKVCNGKHDEEKIILCDECDDGYHISCLTPALEEIPSDGDWYCPECKRDEDEIVGAGNKLKFSNKKAKMPSAKNTSGRDWGRGMACVGRPFECAIVPINHFGPIPGVEVGTCWRFRNQASAAGVHRPLVSGIHGKQAVGAFSIVLSGGYEDDIDNGLEFYYTGAGGRDLDGNKRVNNQSLDQKLQGTNEALARNCNTKFDRKGGEATDWKAGKPVRVLRNYKAAKHSEFAPVEGNRYDGIYKVVKYFPVKGQMGFVVWRFLLKRDDPTPAPWEEGGKELPLIDPPGYKEAQLAKEKEKEAKKSLTKETKTPKKISPENKTKSSKKKTPKDQTKTPKKKTQDKGQKLKSPFDVMKKTKKPISDQDESEHEEDMELKPGSTKRILNDISNESSSSKKAKLEPYLIPTELKQKIDNDTPNVILWEDCMSGLPEGKLKFVSLVEENFTCPCCLEVVYMPVTTSCNHNICKLCLKRMLSTNTTTCPHCRTELGEDYRPPTNELLRDILRTILFGYEGKRK